MLRGVLLAGAGVLGLATLVDGQLPVERAEAGNTVPICHVDGQGRVRLINVNASAVPAHMDHGDFPQVTYYFDGDGDGYGDGVTASACVAPGDGYVTQGGDCNDGDAAVNPAAFDACGDGVDNNCDGEVDENLSARVLLHCDAGSEQILTLCGPGPHDLRGNAFVNSNISYLDFADNTTGANIIKCRLGGTSPDKATITGDTNLCDLAGGCCDDPTRYNDNVCSVELF